MLLLAGFAVRVLEVCLERRASLALSNCVLLQCPLFSSPPPLSASRLVQPENALQLAQFVEVLEANEQDRPHAVVVAGGGGSIARVLSALLSRPDGVSPRLRHAAGGAACTLHYSNLFRAHCQHSESV